MEWLRRSSGPRGRSGGARVRLTAGCALLAVVLGPGWAGAESSEPMRIGLLLDFSGSPETSADRKRGFDLAIRHINDGGGVLGRPVHGVTGDATRSPAPAVRAARHLLEQEGVHAVVGPNASGAALPVVEIVTGPAGIPTISPSATSPRLTDADDDGFFFRTTLADTAQGPVLARVTRDRGFENVGLIYHDDPYGQGLADTFAGAWNGTLRAVPVGDDQATYRAELRRSAGAGAQALVVVTFEDQALAIVREAIDEGIYAQFVFADAAKRTRLVREVGGATLGGMYGTLAVLLGGGRLRRGRPVLHRPERARPEVGDIALVYGQVDQTVHHGARLRGPLLARLPPCKHGHRRQRHAHGEGIQVLVPAGAGPDPIGNRDRLPGPAPQRQVDRALPGRCTGAAA